MKRMFLHAWKLAFVHPLTGERLRLEAPLPPELEAFLDRSESEQASSAGCARRAGNFRAGIDILRFRRIWMIL